jgi:hypothetical protein
MEEGVTGTNTMMEGWIQFGELIGRKQNSRREGECGMEKSTIKLMEMIKRRSRLRYMTKPSGELKQQHCF